MIELKSPDEIEAIAQAGAIIGRLFERLPGQVRPGVTTEQVDDFVDEFVRYHEGAVPAFKGLYGFPKSACISVNDEVVHGIPRRDRTLREGDIVTVDVGVKLDGWFADAAVTLPVGSVDAETRRLLDVTQESLRLGIEEARSGRRLGDIGAAVQQHAEAAGYSVVREFVGHGIGRALHEEPPVPNYGKAGTGPRLKSGMTLAIEPMVNAGAPAVRTLQDGWTAVTQDGRLSAHFEHTVCVTDGAPVILTLPSN